MSASSEAHAPAGLREALFSPRAVALVGASADVSKITSRPQRFMRGHGYKGRIIPVNPGHAEILGEKAYPDLRSAPGPIDHAFIMVPAAAVPQVVAQCCERNVPVATIFSAGFAELGEEGLARQREMVRMARAAGLRLLGPNCMGIMSVQEGALLTVNAVLEQERLNPGSLGVISQSGSMLGTLISRAQARGLGFSKLVSVGNECDLGVGEIADMLVDDPATEAILLFLETFRDARHLASAARRAYAAGKPMVAYKLGRSAVGRRAAASHTGALTGPDEIAAAFFRDNGILRVDVLESLYELPRLVLGHRPPAGRRAGMLTGSGGAAAMVADRLGVLGADVVPPSPRMIANLAAQNIAISDAPITDLPMGSADGGRYVTILSELLASDHCDAAVAVIGSSAGERKVISERILAARHLGRKPLAVYLAPVADESLALLEEKGVAGFRSPESCADAVSAYLNWRAPVERGQAAAGELAAATALVSRAGRARLNERESCELFAALGIPVAESRVLAGPGDGADLGGAVALKVLSADIPHKTEARTVRLNVKPGEELAAAYQEILANARAYNKNACIEGVLAQRMESGFAEVIAGYRHDPEVGPVVLLGTGGIAAELRRSYCVRIAPVSLEEAAAMIEEVRDLALLRGYRNLPRGDCAALARAIRALSLLALIEARKVSEAEINPLIVKREGEGVVAVDGLVAFATEG